MARQSCDAFTYQKHVQMNLHCGARNIATSIPSIIQRKHTYSREPLLTRATRENACFKRCFQTLKYCTNCPDPPLPIISPAHSKAQQHYGMAETIAMSCRIVELETELRLVKDQLLEARNGTAYLVGMLGHQTQAVTSIRENQEMEKLRAQLNKALRCNAHLERLLATSRQARALLETRQDGHTNGDMRVLGHVEGSHYEEDSFVAQNSMRFSGVAECIDDLLGSICEEGASEKALQDGWTATPEKKAHASIIDAEATRPLVNGLKLAVTQPDNRADSAIARQGAVETGTARSVHIRSCSMDDVKQYNVQPLAASQWATPSPGPGHRWPDPEPRPYARRPMFAAPSYEVTHSFDSQDIRLRRTVLIENIPIGMTFAEVLNDLKSDRIIDARFAGTAGMKTRPPIWSNMAYVEFLDHDDAQNFLDVYSKHQMFRLKLIQTPTRPLRRSGPEAGFY